MTTLADTELMNDAEQAAMGKRLAQALADLHQMRADAKNAITELKEGIDAQEVEVARLANLIRTGQKELFPQPPSDFQNLKNGIKRAMGPEGAQLRESVQRLNDQCEKDGATATLIMDGEQIATFGPKVPLKNGSTKKSNQKGDSVS